MRQTIQFAFLGIFFMLALGAGQTASAQTQYLTHGQQKREVRNSIKEAKKVTSDYSESHLDVNAYNLRKGEGGRKLKKGKKRDLMPISPDGTATTKPSLFSKKNASAKARKR
jgi:hypothetical protein